MDWLAPLAGTGVDYCWRDATAGCWCLWECCGVGAGSTVCLAAIMFKSWSRLASWRAKDHSNRSRMVLTKRSSLVISFGDSLWHASFVFSSELIAPLNISVPFIRSTSTSSEKSPSEDGLSVQGWLSWALTDGVVSRLDWWVFGIGADWTALIKGWSSFKRLKSSFP